MTETERALARFAALCADQEEPAQTSICLPSSTTRFGGMPENSVDERVADGEAVTLAELGDPTTSTDYALCLYRHNSVGDLELVLQGRAPAASACGGHPCWSVLAGKGYKYRDRGGVVGNGVVQVTLFAGGAGASKLAVKGKGPQLRYTPAFGPLPVFAELHASNGTCFAAGFKDPSDDDEVIFGGGVGGATFKAGLSSPSGAFVD